MISFEIELQPQHCAIYIRKSAEQNPNHQFGSLEAQ